ncbi:dipeptide epimerase [Roseibium sp. CAU 1637]|uniref:Dipeptide epimerase n=1 Tax=Roseibium limicola TaxID=2816037 RepID=A0A939EPE9_9HYPH|nr:N-acetyl-D-Glu racemase DgcA [Roseibium limicola]MBO0345078.1 dipeptide epimerase [Roseibium limicola]
MAALNLKAYAETFPIAGTFTISRGSRTEAHVVTVEISDGTHTGRGECVPYARYGETLDGVVDTILSLSDDFANGAGRSELQALLKPGAARNALDCALWDLEAKQSGQRAFTLAGFSALEQVTTAYTLSLGTPESMGEQAAKNAARPLLKVKLGGEGDLARIEAVRNGAPDSTIIIDANEGWSVSEYQKLAPEFVRLGVAMVEQPLPAADDDALIGLERVLPVCADESCHDRASLDHLGGKYDLINIKLDKTGGLTEALALREAARAQGFQIMIGCMVGTSLAMAPAVLLAQGAEYVDLDGPLLLAKDRDIPLEFTGSLVTPSVPGLWG